MHDFRHVFMLVIFVLVIGLIFSFQINRMNECNDRGGDYVQGALGYTCVGEDEDD